MNQELCLPIRLDLNSFLKCLMVLQGLVLVSNEFYKIGPVTSIDRSENILFCSMNTVIFGISCRILMHLVLFNKKIEKSLRK